MDVRPLAAIRRLAAPAVNALAGVAEIVLAFGATMTKPTKEPAFYLVKSEPSVYSFDDLLRDGSTVWDGVRNYEARNTLRAMNEGDLCLFYHSNEGKEIVGIARVIRAAYQDPTTAEDWSAIDVAPEKKLQKPVTLAQAKSHPILSQMALVRRSRISVSAVSPEQFAAVVGLSGTPVASPRTKALRRSPGLEK